MTDFPGLLSRLASNEVAFIIIGGAAATAHGSARLTLDLDIVYERTDANIHRLAQALQDLEPYMRGAPPGLPFRFDLATIKRGLNFTLSTTLGALDTLGEVTGGGDYQALLAHTIELDLFGVTCRCIDLTTLIRLKRAAGRPKDLEVIAELETIADEQARPTDSP